MPTYRVELLDRQVRKQLDRIHEPDFSRVAAAILGLEKVAHAPVQFGQQDDDEARPLSGWHQIFG
jgi:hypothetical protein